VCGVLGRWRACGVGRVLAAVGSGAALLVACAQGPAPVSAPAPPAGAGRESAPSPRYAVEPVPVPPSFERAVREGSRTLDGRPGPRYWQQRVSYRIEAELDPRTGRLQGEEVITYRNRSPDTLGVVVLHLYHNVFRAGEPRTERMPVTEGVALERVEVAGLEARPIALEAEPPAGRATYHVDGTLMVVHLPRELGPGDSIVLRIAWRLVVPPESAPRTARSDRAVYQVAQWYPQVAVYDDVRGWHAWPYLGTGEFYLEYGDFDVELTLPEGWLVAATGVLENPDEVLPEPVRARLARALAGDDVVRVVTADDLGPGNATQRAPGGQLTWRFRAPEVRDFAFAASNRYLWDAVGVTLPDADGDGRPERVAVHAFYRPEARGWREAVGYARHALALFAREWHPYPYPQLTAAEGPVYGMEYPMLVFVGAPAGGRELYTVLAHEVAHQWFPMLVGSKESEFAWQDEGLATYGENLALADFFRDPAPFADELAQYRSVAGTEAEKPVMREADLYGPGPAFVVASYAKPALLLRALGAVVGEDTLRAALREYARRWRFRHPMALDFFHTVESVAGRDLDWFWHPWWYETATLDQAIVDVAVEPAGAGERVAVVVEDQGEAPMPVRLAITLAGGETRRVVVPVDVWLRGARRHREVLEVPGRVERVAIDPEERFPDADPRDNVWRRGPG